MCGIIAILRRQNPSRTDATALHAESEEALAAIERGLQLCAGSVAGSTAETGAETGSETGSKAARATATDAASREPLQSKQIDALTELDSRLASVVATLRTPAGVLAVMQDSLLESLLRSGTATATKLCDEIEARLDHASSSDGGLRGADIERANAALLALRDDLWSVGRDGLEAVNAVRRLLSRSGAQHLAAVTAALSVHQALSSLDRLEVRGRDSAGLHLLCSGHGLDPAASDVAELLVERHSPLFENRSVRFAHSTSSSGDDGEKNDGGENTPLISLVVKVAEEIGELGDNVSSLRRDLERDQLLAMAFRSERLEVAVLGHTRWASVGLITEANAHPLNQERMADTAGDLKRQINEPYVAAVLNGDVDNYADLKSSAGLEFADEITTDAKVIPALVTKKLVAGDALGEAFLETVNDFVGSVAIGLHCADDPDQMLLALRGSGQALYVGLAEDAYIVASELYGLVELCQDYVRLDGETPGNPDNPSGSRGQVMMLDGQRAGSLEGLQLKAYDGTPIELSQDDVRRAGITTRDVDRGEFPHFLLKEISEAPRSFEKTLRGKIAGSDTAPVAKLGTSTIPEAVAKRLASGEIQRILVIGQGTAAVAGSAIGEAIHQFLGDHMREVRAMPATELSGFGLRNDMADTLILAISQSGTTTDTNRTVDLVRARGASVLAIVNRRGSDLCDKADGVLFTSDGRDIEMSVASTKAFYSQIAAGFLLAAGLTQRVLGDEVPRERIGDLLSGLRDLPSTLRSVLTMRAEIQDIATRVAPPQRYWALVGNGLNRVAAEEIRIKLSELCYKSIACDATEDKKHIDLSSEPLILVCAAGLEGSTADDVAKEVAIYRAHKAVPVVIASDGEQRYKAAFAVIRVPRVHPMLDFVVASLVGHLFGYGAALAIDAQARPLREVRSSIEGLAHRWIEQGDRAEFFASLLAESRPAMRSFLDELAQGAYNGHLDASTATEVSLLLRTVMGQISLDAHAAIFGGQASPASVIEALSGALTQGIDQLTRPVDAIKHQAKTVTVGISRSDEALLTVPLVAKVLASGADRDRVSYSDLRTLAMLDPVVDEVLGHTRYSIDGDPADEHCVLRQLEAGGMARDLESRTVHRPVLRGTKRRVALDKRLLVARGSADGRLFILVPEVSAGRTQGLVLIHIKLAADAPVSVLRGVLQGYRGRLEQLRDAVMETEDTFREDLLGSIAVERLLIDPIGELAAQWRHE